MSDLREDPWWASGSAPEEGLGDEDPFERHTEARRGAGDGDAGANGHAGHERRDRHQGRGGAWWHDAVDALADAARAAGDAHEARAGRGEGERAASSQDRASDGQVCHACPVCVALRVLDESRPEVVAHLSEALRHVSLAARAFVEAQVAATGGDDGLHRVDLDGE